MKRNTRPSARKPPCPGLNGCGSCAHGFCPFPSSEPDRKPQKTVASMDVARMPPALKKSARQKSARQLTPLTGINPSPMNGEAAEHRGSQSGQRSTSGEKPPRSQPRQSKHLKQINCRIKSQRGRQTSKTSTETQPRTNLRVINDDLLLL